MKKKLKISGNQKKKNREYLLRNCINRILFRRNFKTEQRDDFLFETFLAFKSRMSNVCTEMGT